MIRALVWTGVHEYGGGAYLQGPGGGIIYSDFVSQRLYLSLIHI